jgi:hypothetical protein
MLRGARRHLIRGKYVSRHPEKMIEAFSNLFLENDIIGLLARLLSFRTLDTLKIVPEAEKGQL